jgi:hypothetical protein
MVAVIVVAGNRTLAVGKRIEQEICDEMDHPRVDSEPAKRMVGGSMAHSLKRGILERARGISLRFSPGVWRRRSAAVRRSPWCGTWISEQNNGCKRFYVAVVEDMTRT